MNRAGGRIGPSEGASVQGLPPKRVLGLMSGTSCDGVDGVLARFEFSGGRLEWEVVARHHASYSQQLRRKLLAALRPETSDVAVLTQLHAEIGAVNAELAARFGDADLIALSGQTVYHIPRVDPAANWRTVSTLQLGEASYVVERVRVPVLSDFRQADIAAGGQGAPMVAFGDWHLYRDARVSRGVHNLGGISNVTYLPTGEDSAGVIAFDTGPGNCLLDEAAAKHLGRPFDDGGRAAEAGHVDEAVLAELLRHDYFELTPPKTTGRESFHLSEFERLLAPLQTNDVLATLCAFTAESVARAYEAFVLPLGLDEVLLAGGGAHNDTLVRMLEERLPVPVATFEDCGWDSRDREALAFAVMGYFGYFGQPNTLPQATGAARAVVAGKLSQP